jgi:hypothetical protein
MMNRDWVLFHLKEAHEELTRTIQEVRDKPDYDYGEFFPAMQHLYHHLNTAWNAREASESELAQVTDANFKRWSSFPADLLMFE